jgi:hypothetical protein
MTFSIKWPIYRKVERDDSGVAKEVSGAQLHQMVKAGSRDGLAGLPDNSSKRRASSGDAPSDDRDMRRAQLFARMQANVKNLDRYAQCDERGNVKITDEGQRLIDKDRRKKNMFGVIRAITAPTGIGIPIALAVYKGYLERRDADKYAATDVTPALRKQICEEVKKNPTGENVRAVARKYGVSEYDVVTWAGVAYQKGLYNFPPVLSQPRARVAGQ